MSARAVLVVVALCASIATAASGQAPAVASGLDAVEAALEAQRYDEARRAIGRWWAVEGDGAGGELRARGLFLRAVLSDSLDAAERDLLRVAIEHPQSPLAAPALFRLAQSRSARGASDEARAYLERLVRDHPGSAERPRALALLGQRPADPASRPSPPTAPAAAAERRQPEPRRAPAPAAERRAAPQPQPAERPARPAGPEYTVQVGAFARAADAQALRDRLRAAGFQAFLARAGANPETVVRVGAFRDRAAADALAARIRDAGHSPRVVTVGS